MFQAIRYKNFKTYYIEFIQTYWKKYFPKAPSYNRFVKLIEKAMLAKRSIIETIFDYLKNDLTLWLQDIDLLIMPLHIL